MLLARRILHWANSRGNPTNEDGEEFLPADWHYSWQRPVQDTVRTCAEAELQAPCSSP